MTKKELRSKLNINYSTVKRLIKMGLRKRTTRNGTVYFRESDVDRFIKEVMIPYQVIGGNLGEVGRPRSYFPCTNLKLKPKKTWDYNNDPTVRKRIKEGVVLYHWEDIEG